MELSISAIRMDGGTQPRVKIDDAVATEYFERMLAGDQFPPVIVFHDGTTYWLADGFHRVKAAGGAGRTTIEADVRQGTQQQAQWFSYSVNATHGLRRTREDAKRQVQAALSHPQGAGMSDRQIAEHVGVTHPTVAKIRAAMGLTGKSYQSTERTGADGRTINTANIGRKPAADAGPVNHPAPAAPAPQPSTSAPATPEDSYYTDLRSWLARNYKPDAWIGILAHGKFPSWMMNDRGYEKAARRLTDELRAERAAKAAQEAERQSVAPPAASLVAPILGASKTVGEVVPVFCAWLANFSIEDQVAMLQEVERRTAEGSGIINQIMDESDLVDVRLSTAFAACQSILNTIRMPERQSAVGGEGGASGSGNGNGNGGGNGAYPFVAVTAPEDLLAISEAIEALGTLRRDVETTYALLSILAKRKGFYLNEQEGQYNRWVSQAEASLAAARRAVDRVSEMARSATAG